MMALTADLQASLTPEDALDMLKEGNKRFVKNLNSNKDLLTQVNETCDGQWPFAVILSCIDSRTSAELIFDQGLGDIFSVRIAGNFINQDILGSMEYGCAVAGSKLIVVLGHTKCGALKGALDRDTLESLGMDNLNHLIQHFDVSLDRVYIKGEKKSSENENLLERLNHQNIYKSIEDIRRKSSVLRTMEKDKKIKIVGANYNVTSGVVEWL
ncbi:MAG: carbonic anhydrase [Bergeyella sp.]|nr:carbonic anhydrase [Bergeyella sp.]